METMIDMVVPISDNDLENVEALPTILKNYEPIITVIEGVDTGLHVGIGFKPKSNTSEDIVNKIYEYITDNRTDMIVKNIAEEIIKSEISADKKSEIIKQVKEMMD